ncbi:MAG TPA: group I intron-associated PD-(D/E)XK endonuclease [Actinomycetes bacterium]|nr:group I intron-associated PD-(D/E)XK endonuclease [Actinomycetes bacterium]
MLGLAENNGHAARTLRSRCEALGIDHSHFGWSRGRAEETTRPDAPGAPTVVEPVALFAPRHLRAAGPLLVASALALDGRRVSWPLEPAVYDLVVDGATGVRRVQVKTTTQRAGRSWLCHITRSRYDPVASGLHRRLPYDPDDIDDLAIVDGDLVVYVVPYAEVAALVTVTVSTVAQYAVRRFTAV